MNAIACTPYDVSSKMGRFKFNFKVLQANVKKLQVRIVKAQQTGRHYKVKPCIHLLEWKGYYLVDVSLRRLLPSIQFYQAACKHRIPLLRLIIGYRDTDSLP
jgi:hypothetical protein